MCSYNVIPGIPYADYTGNQVCCSVQRLVVLAVVSLVLGTWSRRALDRAQAEAQTAPVWPLEVAVALLDPLGFDGGCCQPWLFSQCCTRFACP